LLVKVKVENFQNRRVFLLTYDEFDKRVEKLNDPAVDIDTIFKDDKEEPILIAKAYIDISGLAKKPENPNKTEVFPVVAEFEGNLDVSVNLCDQNGIAKEPGENPNDILDGALDFKVKITQVSNLPDDFCRGVYCSYRLTGFKDD
jgi:hypothetical protein